jgi:hypothetical protein
MSWSERIRRLSALSPWTALLMAAIGCGGGDKNPTGPGGGGNDVAELELVRLGLAGLPADAEVEDCTLTRFYGGGITIDQKTGRWEIKLQVHDDNYGDWGYRDQGQTEVDGDTVWFDSEISGTSHAGTVDGPEVKIMYDWCENGVADVQLVFDR